MMLTTSPFSVLISVYRKERPEYLAKALNSIWDKQMVKPAQIVIIKDGELTPELNYILDDFAKTAPVDFIINETNIGLSASLNKGLLACKYELVARMDTDDIAYPNRFKKQIEYFKQYPETDILGSFATKIDEVGDTHEIIKTPANNKDIHRLIWTCPMIHPSVMFRKNKIMEAGSYNPNSGPRQDDYELWFRCAKFRLHFANITQPLLYYRFFSDSIRKNNFKVGWHRFKVGWHGCRQLKVSPIAYIGIILPFVRSMLPYPLNSWFQKLMDKINPRNR